MSSLDPDPNSPVSRMDQHQAPGVATPSPEAIWTRHSNSRINERWQAGKSTQCQRPGVLQLIHSADHSIKEGSSSHMDAPPPSSSSLLLSRLLPQMEGPSHILTPTPRTSCEIHHGPMKTSKYEGVGRSLPDAQSQFCTKC